MYTATAYKELEKEGLVESGVDWNALQEYLNEIGPIAEQVSRKQGVEESPPRIRYDDEFIPGGWVGKFPGGIEVVPDKIDQTTYEVLVSEASGLVESFGLRTAAAGIPFSPEVLDDARSMYLSYSRQLIRLTENLLRTRLPVAIERHTHLEYETAGRLNVQRTMREEATQSGRVASERVTFAVDSPALQLLHRFHRVLQRRLLELRSDFDISDHRLRRQAAYHQRIRRSELPGDTSTSVERLSREDIATLQDSERDSIRELVHLWSAFNRKLAMDINWEQRFSAAIKPISSVYEVWCLRVVLEILEERYGSYEFPEQQRIPSQFDFGPVTLYYDRSVSQCSRYVKNHFKPGPGTGAGNPDFLLVEGSGSNQTVRWVADAKFQLANDLDTSGTLRFLAYLIDYLPENGGRGTLLCIGGTPRSPSANVEGRESRIRRVNPDSLAATRSDLQTDIFAHITV